MYGHMRFQIRRILVGLVPTLLVVGLSSCSGSSTASVASTPAPAQGLERVSPSVASVVVNELAPVIIDVRTPAEYAEGHIDSAKLIDLSAADFVEQIDALDRSATYFVYCRSGNRSATATSAMLQMGFTSIFELDGGVLSWTAQGLPLVR